VDVGVERASEHPGEGENVAAQLMSAMIFLKWSPISLVY
jgi:hypothetical protein